MYSRVLVPIDGGEQASAGLKLACLVAEPYKSRVILLCVSDENKAEEAVSALINEGVIRPWRYKDFVSTLD